MEYAKNSGTTPAANFTGAQRQHLDNLHALLQTCIDHADFKTAASVAAVLLQAHKPNVGTGSKHESDLLLYDREFDYLLMACSEVLKREPLPADQVRTYLRMMVQSHASLYAVEVSRMVVAMLLIEQGDLPQAALVLELIAMPGHSLAQTRALSRTLFTFTRHALTGLLRHRQLLDIMHDAAAPPSSWLRSAASRAAAPPAPAPSPSASSSAPSLVFTYDSRTWLKACANRQLKEVWRDCEKQLKEALALSPGYTVLTYALCHAYVLSGKFSAALDAAKASCAAAPHDVDALSLQCMIRQVWSDQQGMMSSEGQDPESEHDTVLDMTKTLQLDGSCQPALMGLLSRCSHCSGCMLSAAVGCMRHLDMACSAGACTALVPLAWSCLAACLCGLAEEQLQSNTRTQGHGGTDAGGPSVSPGETDDVSPSPAELLDADAAWPSSAEGRWRQLSRELQLRGYWWEHTLLQLPGSSASQHPHRSSSDGSAPQHDEILDVAHRAVVCCFMLRYDHSFVSQARAALGAAAGAGAGAGAAAAQPGGGRLQEAAQLLEHAAGLARQQLLQSSTVAMQQEGRRGAAPLPLVFPMVRRKRRQEQESLSFE